MRTLLQEGQRLNTEFAEIPVIVDRLLGSGGQGEVYAAEMAGELVAVKWYRPEVIVADQALRARLRDMRERKPLSARFLWPIDLVASSNITGFGYVMPFREKRFRELNEVVSGEAPASLRSRAAAGLEMAEAFQALHAAGYCYHDISFGNIAFELSNGEVRICDTDNVSPNLKPGFVKGTPGFMAPEIVQGLMFPTTDSDLWSLAVLLFCMFIGQHPLLGRREYEHVVITESVQDALYGAEALFIFDPHDSSNAPVPGYNDGALRFWPIYPQFLRDLFTQAFTVGVRNPRQRVLEIQWRKAMAALRDAITPCPHCGAENFYHADAEHKCWGCTRRLSPPQCIKLPGHTIVVADGAALFRYHIDSTKRPGASEPIARVVRHPEHADVVGLENLGSVPWRVVLSNGTEDRIDPSQRVRLRPGVRIAFGTAEAVIS